MDAAAIPENGIPASYALHRPFQNGAARLRGIGFHKEHTLGAMMRVPRRKQHGGASEILRNSQKSICIVYIKDYNTTNSNREEPPNMMYRMMNLCQTGRMYMPACCSLTCPY